MSPRGHARSTGITLDAPASAAACSRPSAGVTPTSSLVAATASFRSIAASMVSSASSDEDGAADGAADGGAFGGNGATRFGTLRLRQLCIETSARCPYRTDHVRRVADGKHRNSLETSVTGRRVRSRSLVASSPTLSLYHTAHSLRHQPHIRRHFRLFETPSDRRLFRRLTSLRGHNKLHCRDRPEATRPSAVTIIPPEHSCDL